MAICITSWLNAVNDNLPEIIEYYGSNSRKITCDWYIDDRNFGGLPDWGVIYDMITNNWTFYDYFEKLYAEQEDKPRGFWQRLFGKKD